jgi:predicted PurR-regulated permease PerM
VTDDDIKLPFYIKTALFLLGFAIFIAILYFAKGIIIPVVFALIFAIVLHPVVMFFTRLRMNRILAITLTLVLAFIVFASFGTLIISEFSRLATSWPMLVHKFTVIINQAVTDISGYFDIDPQKFRSWMTKFQDGLINSGSGAIERTLKVLGSLLVFLILLPVYIFLILFYQPLLLEFIHKFFGASNKDKVRAVATQVKTVIQGYLIGKLIEVAIIATLQTTFLLIIGLEYAIIIGIIGALFNIIPYVGGVVGVVLPLTVAMVTKSSSLYILYIILAYYVIQVIDTHFIIPVIVASKVQINALFSIIVVIAGSVLWGIPGMFLAIPMLAILKLICDNVESLKPWGFLLGDSMPPYFMNKHDLKEIKKNSAPAEAE